MDQIKTGLFIAQIRKEKQLTQVQLGDALGVTDRAVSKWERGYGFPDVSLILPLCKILEVDVNELLSGERISETHYKKKTEENLMEMLEKEEKETKKKLTISILVGVLAVVSFVTIVELAGLGDFKPWLRILLIVISAICIIVGVGVAAYLEWDAGTYECKYCGKRFVPTFKQFIFAPHMWWARKLKCPECGKRGYCKKKYTH